MSQEQDRIFFRTFSLVLVILTVFCITVYFIASAIYSTQPEPEVAMIAKRERTEPVGEVNTSTEAAAEANAGATDIAAAAEPAAEAATEAAEEVAEAGEAHPGKAVYDKICFTCHTAGIAGAPKFGDPTAWADRIAKGIDALYGNSLSGFAGEAGIMPPKGGLPTLSDDEVKSAVDYMIRAAEG
jgi:cytochrome c5